MPFDSPLNSPDPVERLRLRHRQQVVRALREHGPLSRSELCERLELSATTMTKLVGGLQDDGLVASGQAQARSRLGRPRLDVMLVPAASAVLAFAIEVDLIRWARVGLDLSVLEAGEIPITTDAGTVDATLDRIAVEARRQAAEVPSHGRARHGLLGLAVALPGLIDDTLRISVRAPHIGWSNVDVATRLERATGLRTILHNNVRCLALAERRHRCLPAGEALLYVQTRVGVGAAVVSDTAATIQPHGVVSELGNVLVRPAGDHAGASVRLGAVVVEPHLRRELGLPADGGAIVPVLEARCAAGDAAARRLYAQTVHFLASGLSVAIDLLNPRTIVLGGIYAQASDRLLGDLLRQVHGQALDDYARQVTLLRSATVGSGARVGAAMVGFDHFLSTR